LKSILHIIIGAYGSGKSEYSVHFARQLKKQGLDVVLADMDVVNPYFRTRDILDVFAQEGIEVIAPEGQFRHADVPMLSPRIKGAIENSDRTVLLDVGGDPAGCRTLGRFADDIQKRGYHLICVINTCRPFTSTPEEIVIMLETLEFSSKLKISELVCNTNLMEYTTESVVTEGIKTIQTVSDKLSVPFQRYLVLDKYIDIVPDGILGKYRDIMTYTLKKPWEKLTLKGI
jgi:hypothetical protein